MTRTITRLIDNYSDAQAAVAELEKSGIPHSDISIVASNADGAHDHHGDHAVDGDAASRGAGKGASVGGVLGGGAGLLAGLGIMAVPGLGPVVAAGWLVSTLAGVVGGAVAGGAAGGLVGSLKHAGVSEADAHVYSEGVRRGGTLVSVKVDDATEPKAREILSRFRATDAATRGAAYRATGWTAHDPDAPAYTAEQVAQERKTYLPTI
jgi:hypothetical protein